MRYKKNLKISRNLLAQRLKAMESAGLANREIPEGSRRAIYMPTRKCRDLTNTLLALSEWSEKWMPDPAGPRINVSKTKNGKSLKLALVTSEQADKLDKNDFQLKFRT
jgi:DNA-binding HxlR family transcriptional regulator